MSEALCEACGEPMPAGEEMFKYHGYSGKCPKPLLEKHKKHYDLNLSTYIKGEMARKAESEIYIHHVFKEVRV